MVFTNSYADKIKYHETILNPDQITKELFDYCYKLFHDCSPIKPEDLFVLSPRGHRQRIFIQLTHVEGCKQFFHALLHSSLTLPHNVVEAPTPNVFKCKLHVALQDTWNSFIDI